MPRVSVGKAYHPLYQEIIKKDGGRRNLFPTMKDFFMYNLVLGVRNGVPADLEGNVDVFGSEVFSEDDVALIYAIYLAESKDLTVLEGKVSGATMPPKVLENAERYANAGASIMQRQWAPQKQEISFSLLLLDPKM